MGNVHRMLFQKHYFHMFSVSGVYVGGWDLLYMLVLGLCFWWCSVLCSHNINGSGESMENALRACCKGIIGKILIYRDGDNGKQVRISYQLSVHLFWVMQYFSLKSGATVDLWEATSRYCEASCVAVGSCTCNRYI